jgi:excisionase family DNA binding protein
MKRRKAPKFPKLPVLLEPTEVAYRLRTSKDTIFRFVKAGRLRVAAVTRRRARLFDPRDVERLRRERRGERRLPWARRD